MEKEKKSIPKIILHICEYILLGFIIFLIIFVVLKACEKDVKALDQTASMEALDQDLQSQYLRQKMIVIYFNFQNQDQDLYELQILLGPTAANFYMQRVNNNFVLAASYWNGSQNIYTTFGSFGENDNIVVSIGTYFKTNNQLSSRVYFLDLENEHYTYKGELNYDHYYTENHQIIFNINSRVWLATRYSNNIPQGTDLPELDMLGAYNSPNIDPYEYRHEHLFGDVISSFLNIQFGEFTVGNTTYSLTLGMLLLFIIGLGALFIIIKVFLGG